MKAQLRVVSTVQFDLSNELAKALCIRIVNRFQRLVNQSSVLQKRVLSNIIFLWLL